MIEPDANAPHLVGVGSSAGGLSALSTLVSALPTDSGMAFFVVQHLGPTQPSALVEVLSRSARLPVQAASDGARIQPDVIYVAQPGAQLTIDGPVMRLHTNGTTHTRPIDVFLRSLAATAGRRSIGILLSGSGTDGCLGLTAVREAGGFTLVQDGTAQFPGMPQAAIDAKVVDRVLPPAAIARELAALVQHPYVCEDASTSESGEDDPSDRDALSAILGRLYRRRGVSFAQYKRPTLMRRIGRRMVVRKVASLAEYARLLAEDNVEIDSLFEEVLISVTEFFRDPATFESVGGWLERQLMATPQRTEPLRLWVVGCASGEEAYSLAMVAVEVCDRLAHCVPIKIFGTDISEAALAIARAGIYTGAQCSQLTEERREQFFSPSGGDLQIRKEIRDLCVFARHDVAHDPPFSRMDVIGCRNVLIYFDNELQHRVIPTLHYALRPGGLLVLGRSESIGRNDDLFESGGETRTIYTRRIGSRDRLPDLHPMAALVAADAARASSSVSQTLRLARHADRVVLSRHGPPGVVIDAHAQVLQFRGDTSAFLRNAPGRASLELHQLARPDLRGPMSDVLGEARKRGREAVREAVWLRDGRDAIEVTLRVVPLGGSQEPGYLVTFESPSAAPGRLRIPARLRRLGRRIVDRLEAPSHGGSPTDAAMLASTRAELRRLLEEHQTKTEELNAANEQVVSSNEELQSSNEELQTAKEEVLATNEELTTVNEELEQRNAMLSRAHDDLANLLSSTNIPIVMVAPDRRIRWFTPNAGPVLNLTSGDIGRLIDHVEPSIGLPALQTIVQDVIGDQRSREHTVQDARGTWLRVAVTPYRTTEAASDGAVISIVDVDALKRAEAELLRQRTYAEWIVDTVNKPLLIMDDALRVVAANRAYSEGFAAAPGSLLGHRLSETDARWDRDDLRTWLTESFSTQPPLGTESTESTESTKAIELVFDPGGAAERQLRFEANRILGGEGSALLLIEIQDVTALRGQERHEAELVNEVLRAQAQERESLARELHDETGQVLSALLVGLRALSERITDREGQALANELRERLRELIDAVGRLARGLHPTTVEDLGLVRAVRELAEAFGRTHAICVELDVEPDEALDTMSPNAQLAIYRVIQEGLTNVGRHARAGHVAVLLSRAAGTVDIRIGDDGKGLDPPTASSPGLGLRLMQRRVAQLGGELSLGPRHGGGTVLEVRVPLEVGHA